MNRQVAPSIVIVQLVVVALVNLSFGALAQGAEEERSFSDLGYDLEGNSEAQVELSGYFRARGEALHNLDLDRGLTPSGRPLYPTPLGDEAGQMLRHGDMRLRTDLRAYSPVGAAAVNLRVDVLDNLAFGSTPEGPPQATVTQRPLTALSIRRAYAEALTPVGLLTVGRMGSHWGLGLLTHGGDDLDSDSGDAADRIAFITPVLGHIWALAYDIAWSGPQTERPAGQRMIDLDPADNMRALTLATMQYDSAASIARRRRAGRTTINYGAYFSFRWQERDVPATYLPAAPPQALGPADVMYRGFRATAFDLWLRLSFPWARLEAEVAILQAQIDQASVVPGVEFSQPLESLQIGAAVESEVRPPHWAVGFGLDAGFASGDPAPGFGAYPGPFDAPGEAGDLDGPQADPPRDNRIDNFRFHPDYRVDQILFREIIGTVTDAFYLKPHLTWDIGQWGPSRLQGSLAAIASWATEPASTPGQARPLGVEFNPSLRYVSHDNFSAVVDHGFLLPLAGLDNSAQGLAARPAQVLRLRLAIGF